QRKGRGSNPQGRVRARSVSNRFPSPGRVALPFLRGLTPPTRRPVVPGGIEPPLPPCHGDVLPLDHGTVSTPSRTRTCNLSFEAKDDVRFTIRASVDPQGLEPRFPARQAGVLPLDDRPDSRQWTAGDSHPDFPRARRTSSCWTSSPVQWRRWESNPSRVVCKT